ncbi:MAG: PQQ-binding-like beta-propeller repeat protein [Pirellulales bacterium]
MRRCLAAMGLALAMWMLADVPASAQEKGIGDFPKLSAKTDWPWWRGPTRNGIASEQPVPTKLSATDNVVWKAAVPGRGHSSPTVVGQKVFLTTADESQQVHYVLAFDRGSGEALWQTEINRGGFPDKNHPKNTEATPTVASDGEKLFATFFHHEKIEAVALDFEGKILWRQVAGPFNPQAFEYGYAPSPLIYRKNLIVSGEYDGKSFLTALDRKSGKLAWRTPRPEKITFSSPIVANVGGKDHLFLSGSEKVAAYNPNTGKPLWAADGTTAATCGSMVWDGDIVFASGGYPKAETIAVKADRTGKVLWRNNQKCYEQSMLAHDGYLYALTDNGVIYCWRGADGSEMWKERLEGPVSASPVLAGGHIYWANEAGKLYVFRPNPDKFDLVEENQLGTDAFASPAICGGQIFLRVGDSSSGSRKETLYCFGSKK